MIEWILMKSLYVSIPPWVDSSAETVVYVYAVYALRLAAVVVSIKVLSWIISGKLAGLRKSEVQESSSK